MLSFSLSLSLSLSFSLSLSLLPSIILSFHSRVAEDNLLVERQKLEADRADFAAHVSSASRAAEVS
jgi:hypothetical protein